MTDREALTRGSTSEIAKPRGPFTLRICAGCGQQINDGHHAHDGRLAPVYDVPAALYSQLDYVRSELRVAEGWAEDLDELVCERFNPPDDDSHSAYRVIETVATYVEAQPCTCTPEQIEDLDACPRCRVLGRIGDEPVSR